MGHVKRANETTLTHLTKRFVRLLNTSQQRVINLNDASKRLEVPKRRIYDITNVLEGIGLLQKTAKNVTRWIDCPNDSSFAARQQPASDDSILDPELLELKRTYQLLDTGIKEMEANIRKIFGADGAHVTYQDVKAFFNDQIVIAVKAPPETRLEVNESLQIWMKCERNEAIEVYLCPQYANNTNNNINNSINNTTHQPPLPQQLQQQNGYQINTSPHLQQSQLSNSSNAQPSDTTITNTSTGQQPQLQTHPQQSQSQDQMYMLPVSSDEGRGRSSVTTDGQYYEPTSGVSHEDNYYLNDPTLSSALSGTTSEDEDPFKPLVPFEAREETHYNFMLDENYTISSLFPEDNLGLI